MPMYSLCKQKSKCWSETNSFIATFLTLFLPVKEHNTLHRPFLKKKTFWHVVVENRKLNSFKLLQDQCLVLVMLVKGQTFMTNWDTWTEQRLCPNSGSVSFEGRIWRPITSQRCAKVPPTNAAFFSLFVEDALVLFVPYPKILCVPEKEERQKENGDIKWHRSSLSQAWGAEIMA